MCPAHPLILKGEGMEKIRVKTYVRVEVNDAGDTIDVYVADMGYRQKFNEILLAFDAISARLESREFKEMGAAEQTQCMMEQMTGIVERIDLLFGNGCCRKVFGDIIPPPDYVADFFCEIEKIFRRYNQERRRELQERYSAGRTGGRG